MDLLNVLDTAIKIGLGAVISGVTTYVVAKQSYARELQKISYIRRLDSLEQISDKAEEHFASWRNMTRTLGGIYHGRNPPNPKFTDKQWELIRNRDVKLLETREFVNHAVARLRLLSVKSAPDCLSEYTTVVGGFRDKLILRKETPAEDDFNAAKEEAKECIRRFHEAMSAEYLSMEAGKSRFD